MSVYSDFARALRTTSGRNRTRGTFSDETLAEQQRRIDRENKEADKRHQQWLKGERK